MKRRRRPPQPDPSCLWSDEHQAWLWPDDRSPAQRAADEAAEKAALHGDWERYGFHRTRAARVDRQPPGPPKQRRAR